jgi:hypothetical protein
MNDIQRAMEALYEACIGIATELSVRVDDATEDGTEVVEIRTSYAKAKSLRDAIEEWRKVREQ